MSSATLTCDRRDGLWRAALWQGGELRDLYIDRIKKPDMTGAVVGARVVRIASGHKAAWCDGGLGTMIYVENPGPVRSGDARRVRINTTARHGKAWGGVFEGGELRCGKTGMLIDPPRAWQRAVMEAKGVKITALTFAEREDRTACQDWLSSNAPQHLNALQPLAREPLHPELDDTIETLCQPVVDLQGGGNIVIEQTEALVAIDVNSGDAVNALAVNLQAVKEIARQIRWRNLSGIIVIDALKMKQRTDRAKLLNALGRSVAHDPAGVQVFGLTKLGLIEMTRTRRGPSLSEILE